MPETKADEIKTDDGTTGREADFELLREAVNEGGRIAKHYYDNGFEHWDKAKGDPVSEADLAVDKALKEALGGARPDYGWLSEETEDDLSRLERERVWIVDPIDGTRAFVKNRPHFTICAALVEHGLPVLGAVFNPITDEFYDAELGNGAKCNGEIITVGSTNQLENCKMLSYENAFNHKRWADLWPKMNVEARNSVALRMVLVAGGGFDACLSLNSKSDWDLAAADLIAREAGALVTDHHGENFIYNQRKTTRRGLITANEFLHAEIIERVRTLQLT